MKRTKKISIIEQLTKEPPADKLIEVFFKDHGGIAAYCYQPAHCVHGFGNPDGNDRGCYGDRCPSTVICKLVGNEGLRWEYI